MIDHVVYATTDLEATVAELAERLGVEPTPGGVHPGRGTRNELVQLGARSYLEIIGPDDDQPGPAAGRPFGIDQLTRPRLVAWCARPSAPLEAVAAAALTTGWDLGPIESMSRTQVDGTQLSWRLTLPTVGPWGIAVLPFMIDWGASVHPTATLDHDLQLLELRIEHPRPEDVAIHLEAVGALTSVELIDGSSIRLSLLLDTPGGPLVLS